MKDEISHQMIFLAILFPFQRLQKKKNVFTLTKESLKR